MMFPCKFKERGCSAVFQREYGARIHLRSCIHKQGRGHNNIKTGKKRYPLPVSLGERRYAMHINQNNETNETDMNMEGNTLADEDIASEKGIEIADILTTLGSSSKGETQELLALDKFMLKLGHISRLVGRRCVSELIQLIRCEKFDSNAFQRKCRNPNDCIELEEKLSTSNLKDHGFKLVIIKDPDSNIECDVHVRSLVSFLRKQVDGCNSDDTLFNPGENEDEAQYSHPMLARLGKEGIPAVINSIMCRMEQETLWCTDENNGGRSFVGMLQLYSDKSRTTLKESAFEFYPFHVTLLNFCDEYKRQCIANGMSLVAFLPVSFYRRIDDERIKSGITRLERLKMLHLSITFILSELKEVAYSGFVCKNRDGVNRVCHPCLGSYCCDLPEAKDLTSVKNGNSSLRNCHRCLARTDTFNLYTKGTPRKGEESVQVIEKARKLRKEFRGREADGILHDHSLIEQIPFLNDFPFVGATDVLDLHNIFHFEPLHNFHLGISKELKRCLSERLRAEHISSSALPTKRGKKRSSSFRMLRLTILFGINKMLAHIQRVSPAKDLRIDFSNAKGSFGSGLYVEDGKLVGMLEAQDYKAIDKISPFIGMIADRCCDEVVTAPTTTLFVQYVDIMQISMSYNCNSGAWTEDRISELERKIEIFKKNALSLYGTYHASALCTEKFHQLDHICEDIRNMGGLRSGDAGLYEHEHTDIKRANRSGSRKNHTAMMETVSSYVKEKYYLSRKRSEYDALATGKEVRLTTSEKAIKSDSAILVKNGKSFTIGDIDRGRRIARRIRIARQELNQTKVEELEKEMKLFDEKIRELLHDIGEVGCRVLVNELLNSSETLEEKVTLSRDSLIRRVASGYVSGIQTPTSDNYDKRWKKIRVSPPSSRRPQRIVSSRGFSGSSVLRQDSVLIQASDPSPSGTLCLWVGKVLGLFRVPIHSTAHSMEGRKEEKEYAFVQFYDAVPPMDEIDKALGCIRMVWATAQEGTHPNGSNDDDNIESVSPWYSLVPIASLRGVVHVIRGDYGIDGICAVRDVDSVPWFEQHFYVNRFYFESNDTER